MSDIEPQRPEMSDSVRAFFEERGYGTSFEVPTLDALGGDAPPNVLRWLEAWQAWRFEREAWARRQPLDQALANSAWRMFGGPWLPWGTYVDTCEDDGTWFRVHLISDFGNRIAAGASEDELRAVALAIYEWHASGQTIDKRLVRRLR